MAAPEAPLHLFLIHYYFLPKIPDGEARMSLPEKI